MRAAFEAAKITNKAVTTPLVATILRTMEKQDTARKTARAKRKAAKQ
jgi:hypothetical protein